MRESIESLSSPHSPSLENGMDDTDATTSSLTNDTQIDQKMDTMDQHLLCATNEDSMPLSPKVEEDSTCKGPEFEEAEDSQVKDVSSACVHFESNGGKYSKKSIFMIEIILFLVRNRNQCLSCLLIIIILLIQLLVTK